MPETDGRALGRIIGERYHGLPVLYVSAYPTDDVFHRGAPNPLVPFLQQPFLPDAVLMLVRRLLTTSAFPDVRSDRLDSCTYLIGFDAVGSSSCLGDR
jgi:DNA-binding NtrC family response regulator